ncbi:MAG: GtrA family protein [Clostridia bacterium]|nr:GtrA family protein [Clostridia bacterium]
MINFLKKHKELILYLIVGGLTTLVNIAAYALFAYPLSLGVTVSTVLAWGVSVIFAFVANKLVVFESKNTTKKKLLFEIGSFFLARLASGVLDVLIMFIFVDLIHINDIIMKIVSNVIVIIINYALSKFVIFKKEK